MEMNRNGSKKRFKNLPPEFRGQGDKEEFEGDLIAAASKVRGNPD